MEAWPQSLEAARRTPWKCGGRDAEKSPQSRHFLPPFHRYINLCGKKQGIQYVELKIVPVARHRTGLTMVDFPVSANVQPGYTSLVLSISPCHYLPEDVDSDIGEAERVVLLVARVKGSGRQHTRSFIGP
jgi:hypothetical protein